MEAPPEQFDDDCPVRGLRVPEGHFYGLPYGTRERVAAHWLESMHFGGLRAERVTDHGRFLELLAEQRGLSLLELLVDLGF